MESAPKGKTNFFIIVYLFSIGRGSMNDPFLWNLHTAQVPKVMRRGISPALSWLGRKGVFCFAFLFNCQRWNKELSALSGYPYSAQRFFCPISELCLNWLLMKKEALGNFKKLSQDGGGGNSLTISTPLPSMKAFRMRPLSLDLSLWKVPLKL